MKADRVVLGATEEPEKSLAAFEWFRCVDFCRQILWTVTFRYKALIRKIGCQQ